MGLTAGLWVVLLLVVVMVVVVGPQKVLLALAEPCDPAVYSLLTRGRLGHHGGAVDVVVLHVGGLDLVDGVDGDGVLQATVGHPSVQQWLRNERGGHSGDVMGDPGLHV